MGVNFGRFGRFWVILAIFGRFWVGRGSGGVRTIVDGPCRGQLRAWQGSGEGSGTEVGEGSRSDFGHFGSQGSKFEGPRSKFEGPGSILAILGRFGTFLGPCPESEKFGHGSGTSQKDGSRPGDFGQDLDGRVILGSKI